MANVRKELKQVAEELKSGDRSYLEFISGNTAIAGKNVQEVIDPVVSPVEEALVNQTAKFSNVDNLMGLMRPFVDDAVAGVGNAFNEATADYPRVQRAGHELMDSMSLVPFWLGKRAASNTKSSYTQDPSIKGMLMSEGDMIHPSLYGVSKSANPLDPHSEAFYDLMSQRYQEVAKGKGEGVNPLDRKLIELAGKNIMPQGSKLGKLSAMEGLQRTAKGWVDWLEDGAKRAYSSFNDPEARALYAEAGITQIGKKKLDEYMLAKSRVDMLKERKANGEKVTKELAEAKKQATQAANVAIQQMQAGGNIAAQSGKKLDGTFIDEIAREASDPTVLKIKGEPYFDMKGDWYEESAWEAIKDNAGRVSMEDIEVIQRHVPWSANVGKGDNVKVIIKRASSADTGRHFEDLFQNNPKLAPVAKAFQTLPEGTFKFGNQSDLMKALKSQQMVRQSQNSEWKPKYDADGKEINYGWKKKPEQNFSIKYDNPESPDNARGIWIQTSRVGSAKVEGSVNQLFRVAPDGHLVGVMSDKHDFLENIQGLKQMFKKELPNDVIAVTLPLEGSIFKSSSVKFKDAPEIETTARKTSEGSTGRAEAARDRLDRAAATFPSPQEIARQKKLVDEAARERAIAKLQLGGAVTAEGMLTGQQEEEQ